MAIAVARPVVESKPVKAARQGAGPGRWILLPLAILTVVAVVGAPYYALPRAEQLRSPLHAWYRPSGYIGQAAGVLTFAGFLFMWLFPLRKKFRKAKWAGPVPRWLDVHIAVGLVLPLLGAIHAGFRVGGLIGLGYISMLIVCASGVIGRYLYVRIPRSRTGVEMGLSDLSAHQRMLLGEIADASGLSVFEVSEVLRVESADEQPGILRAFVQMFRDDFSRRRAVSRLRGRIGSNGKGSKRLKEIVTLARREMSLSQQARLLDTTQAIFRYWHAAHRPFAITAFVAVTIHVVVVIAVGATWF